jgi:glycosyltransferase involved in cell wall biosynthesis
MKPLPNIIVLMSVYNPGAYLEPQLLSILKQSNVSLKLLIRDDGSSEYGALASLNNLISTYSNIDIITQRNIGIVNSFLSLINYADNNYDYYAFSDQDDVWHKNKLLRATALLTERSDAAIPAMYCSRVEYVAENLEHIGYSEIPSSICFEHALVENIAFGCTIVINKAAKDILSREMPSCALMHDWWVYLVISALGKVIYDSWPSMKYRQHNKNAVGGTNRFFIKNMKKLLLFIKNIQSGKKRTTDQAEEFKKIYEAYLNKEQNIEINNFIKPKTKFKWRLKLIFLGKFNRQNAIDNFFYKIQILLGKY